MRIDPTQKKIVAVMTVLVIAFVALGWWPARSNIAELREQIATTQQKILGVEHKADDLAELDYEVKRIRNEIESSSKVIPRRGELAELIRELSDRIEAAELRDQSISTEQTIDRGTYATLPLHISFNGRASNAIEFVHAIENMPRLMQVTQLQLESNADKGGVDTQLELNTYYYTTSTGAQR